MPTWENFITLNSELEPDFSVLDTASRFESGSIYDWSELEYADALAADTFPLPETRDREGYYGPDHFSYWASGLKEARRIHSVSSTIIGREPRSFLDFGCASGRLTRHFGVQFPNIRTLGCDINRLHVEWCNRYLPATVTTFQNNSIPSLPLASGSIELISAFSVFTHIEAMETAWLMELERVLAPGGVAWITVHTENTLKDLKPDWPLWDPVMLHPEISNRVDLEARDFAGDRLVLRWHEDRSYSSNIFYKTDYIRQNWGRIFDVRDIIAGGSNYQDVVLLVKRA